MRKAAEYRGLAAKFRREAEGATLPQVRASTPAAAERWELLAEEHERSIQMLGTPLPKWVF